MSRSEELVVMSDDEAKLYVNKLTEGRDAVVV